MVVAVRAHPLVDLLEDGVFSLSCGRSGLSNSRSDITLVKMSLTDGYRSLRAGQEDYAYNLRAQVLEHDPGHGLLVTNCLAFTLAGTVIQLVDDRGCRNDKFLSEWTYDTSSGRADTTLYSLRRLPQSNRTFYQCDVQLCQGECQLPECEAGAGGAGVGSPQLFIDTVTGSTTVFVADSSIGAAGALGVDCNDGDGNPSFLRGLTIAFGVLFGIMLLINIFLCSAMTCSCTRTEVIEKEPSIYDDDYSMYDSQYGYASKVYNNSESDYGSDYGGGLGQDRSEYSGHNGVSRSRPSSHHGSRYLDQ